MSRRSVRLAVLSVALAAGVAAAADYPQWRGPARDGVSPETGLLKNWPPAGPPLAWRQEGLGFGYGSPAVAGDRMYLVSNEGLENEFVQALDTSTGRRVWSTRIGKVGNPDQQPSYPGARSTPTLAEGELFVLGSDGDLACLEAASGRVRWRRNLRTDFGGSPGVWAYSESPLVVDRKVIVTPGGAEATVVALDRSTGQVVWKCAVPGGDPAGYSSAVSAVIAGVPQVVQFLGKGLVGIHRDTGRFLWRSTRTVDNRFGVNATTPVVAGDLVYSSSAAGGGVTRVSAQGETLLAEPAYLERRAPTALGGSVRAGEFLYGTSGSQLVCVEFATGRLRWEDRCVGAGSVCLADGRLYVHGENGVVALVEATPEAYRELGRFTPPDPPQRGMSRAWAYPVVAGGRLYIRDLGVLWAYDLKPRPE